MDEQTPHEALLGMLAETIAAYQAATEETRKFIYADAVSDLQKVFAYLYVFGGQADESNETEADD